MLLSLSLLKLESSSIFHLYVCLSLLYVCLFFSCFSSPYIYLYPISFTGPHFILLAYMYYAYLYLRTIVHIYIIPMYIIMLSWKPLRECQSSYYEKVRNNMRNIISHLSPCQNGVVFSRVRTGSSIFVSLTIYSSFCSAEGFD